MRFIKLLFVIAILILIFGCRTEHQADESNIPGHRAVTYPPASSMKFPEEQVIKDQFEVTKEWRTVTFKKPLQINRDGLMGLHLVVDQKPYISTMDEHPLNPECNEPGCELEAFCLRRLSDGAVIRPEAILIGDNGEEVKVRPRGNMFPHCDKTIMTISLRTFAEDINAPPPPFPEGISSFKSMRVRSTEPFWVRFLWWSVERHPDLH